MKALLLFPKNYTLKDIFEIGFEENGWDTVSCDFNSFFSSGQKKRQSYLLRLPFKFKRKYLNKINSYVNKRYVEVFNAEKPDLVLVYNEQKLFSETVSYFKKKSKVAFFLGDNPLFIKNRPDNLSAIIEADHIFAPDSFWIEQLQVLGINKISYLIPGYNQNLNYKKVLSDKDKKMYGSDVVFIGRQYHDTMGYKRALFYNQFSDLDLKIYGNAVWNKWFEYFPKLKSNFILNKQYLSFETINTILNASKVYPIDANPGIVNGLHIRIFDCIGSGILPIVEYKKDIDIVFKDLDLPTIKNYIEAKKIVEYFVKNDHERETLIEKLRQHIDKHYTPTKAVSTIIKKVF